MRKTTFQAFACLSFSFIIACSGNSRVTQGNDAAASVYKPNDLTSASAQISADKGGYINVGKAQLRIPAQALETDTTISAEIVDMQLPAGEAKAVGKGIRLLPEGLQFLKPADLMLCYSATEMANLNAQDTKIYYQVSGTQYAAVAGTVDMNTNCVSSHIEHFSSYVAAAQALAQTSLAPTAAVATTLPGTPMTGIPLYLRAIITPRSGASIATAYVNYRVKGSGSGYTKVALQPDSTDDTVANRYYFAIPASEVVSAGIEFEYYFDATDNLNKSVRSPGGTAVATTIPAVATTGLRFTSNPVPAPGITVSAGFNRNLTLQASYVNTSSVTVWQNISADNFSLTNSAQGTLVRIGPSTVRFGAVGAGAGQVTSVIGAFSTALDLTVIPGLLTHIEITDTNQVALSGTIQLPTSLPYDFDVVGYDAFGNVAQVYPVFTTTGGIGSVTVDISGAHFNAAASSGSGTIVADLSGLTDTLNISLYVPPQVTATAPFDSTTGIALNSSIGVSFSRVMDTATLTTTTSSACVGSLQVSSDNFATCVAMTSATPSFFASNTLAVIQPAANLSGTTIYKIRVTTAARDTNNYPLAMNYTTPTGFTTVANTVQSGAALWARTTSIGSQQSYLRDMAIDNSGYIYVVGFLGGGLYSFGPGVSVNAPPVSAFYSGTPVIIKYDSTGTAQWAKIPPVSATVVLFQGIATDNSGNLYVAGSQHDAGTNDYGNGVQITTTAGYQAILLKYDANGNTLWGKTVDPQDSLNFLLSEFNTVCVDGNGDVILGGALVGQQTALFGSGVTILPPATMFGQRRAMVAKYNSSGNAIWAHSTSGFLGAWSVIYSVTTDTVGNVYAVGEQNGNGSAVYGPSVTVSSISAQNALILKYDTNGNALWGRTPIVAPNDSGFTGVKTDSIGNVYAVGSQGGTLQFAFGIGSTAMGTNSISNGVLVKYDSAGSALWSRTNSQSGSYSGFQHLEIPNDNEIYVSSGQIGSGIYQYGNTISVSGPFSGGTNAVILKFDNQSNLLAAKTLQSSPDVAYFFRLASYGTSLYAIGELRGTGLYYFENAVTAAGSNPTGLSTLIVKYQR